MKVFLDSSALVKRYIFEVGTPELMKACHDASRIILSVITAIEIPSAIARRLREGALSKAQYKTIKENFSKDLAASDIVELYPAVIRQAVRSLEKYPLRSLDAIQVASALIADVDLFITSDERQRNAARKLKLKTILI